MAVDTQHPDVNAGRETSESLKIYSLDDHRNPKNIYLNTEGLKGKQRRYFTHPWVRLLTRNCLSRRPRVTGLEKSPAPLAMASV